MFTVESSFSTIQKILKYNVIDGKENPTVDTSIFEIYIIQEHTKVF